MSPSPRPTREEMVEAGRAFAQQLHRAQASLDRALVTGRSADGTVVVLATGLGQLRAVQVNPVVFDRRDVAALQDAIAQSIRAAAANAAALAGQKMGPAEINLY
ncbi:YbaB/EbfC family nucleoid-associated protein [Micromonospora cathayae]|uniref:YbaB/EbfC family nucleoid-associated protein n=1 Tax=Micromonospora cathayae TaxID=3028804 RepID=A0ABY7ZMK5_9ACTN|nr:YbaB/EbfC family nucleoid-associated protein [Micromonospora sp. HUAS 3]WDZ83733.1 YbaB/EbfC family nucleoid-associated protein [Micromonospora sp. HUAS 3]